MYGPLPHTFEYYANMESNSELVVELSTLSGRLNIRVELHQSTGQSRLRHWMVHEFLIHRVVLQFNR